MLGYLAYGGVHYWLHHRSTRHLPPLRRLKRHHALHHHRNESCNFGVSTRFWDRVFGAYYDRAKGDTSDAALKVIALKPQAVVTAGHSKPPR